MYTDSQRHTYRQTQTHTHSLTHSHTHTHRDKDSHTDLHTHTQTHTDQPHTHRFTHTQTHSHTPLLTSLSPSVPAGKASLAHWLPVHRARPEVSPATTTTPARPGREERRRQLAGRWEQGEGTLGEAGVGDGVNSQPGVFSESLEPQFPRTQYICCDPSGPALKVLLQFYAESRDRSRISGC